MSKVFWRYKGEEQSVATKVHRSGVEARGRTTVVPGSTGEAVEGQPQGRKAWFCLSKSSTPRLTGPGGSGNGPGTAATDTQDT